ncbi:GNAT family N-acetyltransferase [Caenimonas terrae]|uniref:GNAT family N-acetyltransferase n=1 Tax=Caenimonas terrae TaxID=696074 RepID=A0ABW0NHW7_9BURK
MSAAAPPTIRDLRPGEAPALGRLLVAAYSQLEGFPTPQQQPRYYEMLAGIGSFADKPGARVLVAVSADGQLMGGVVYFGDMAQYGSGGAATAVRNASGIRLLGVDPAFRGSGAGKALTLACIRLAREQGHGQVILHTTQAMQVAWRLYESLGFVRAEDLDFSQQGLSVFGFRLALASAPPALERIDHIHVFVADRAAAQRWYAEVLGLTPAAGQEAAAGGAPVTVGNPSGSVQLALFERPPQACRSVVAFAATGSEFLAWRAHLAASLGRTVDAVDHDDAWSMYFHDPDGNPFEITTYDYDAVRGRL